MSASAIFEVNTHFIDVIVIVKGGKGHSAVNYFVPNVLQTSPKTVGINSYKKSIELARYKCFHQ